MIRKPRASNLFGILILILLIIMVQPSFCKLNSIKRTAESKTFLTELVHIHTLKLVALFAIPLFFIFLPLLLFGGIALLFIPIPILSNPVTGIAAAIGRRHSSQDDLEQLFHEISHSRECIERISCEIGRSISSLEVRGIADQTMNQLSPYLKDKWKSTVHGYVFGSNGRNAVKNNCSKYICNLASAISSGNWSF